MGPCLTQTENHGAGHLTGALCVPGNKKHHREPGACCPVYLPQHDALMLETSLPMRYAKSVKKRESNRGGGEIDVLSAFVLLILLVVHIERKDKSIKAERAVRKATRGDMDWIDELEIIDAATDDFI